MKRARDIKDQLVELCKRVEIDFGINTSEFELWVGLLEDLAGHFGTCQEKRRVTLSDG